MGEDGFKEFKVTVPENRRYWEDDTTGVLVKRGQDVTITQRQFRSVELKTALLRSQVLVKEGECNFVYKDNLIKITPGNDKNNIEVISGPEYQEKKETKKIKIAVEE